MRDYIEFRDRFQETIHEKDKSVKDSNFDALLFELQKDLDEDRSVVRVKDLKYELIKLIDLEELGDKTTSKQIYDLFKKILIKSEALIQFKSISKWGRVRSKRKWIIDDWMPEGSLGMLVGQGGSGKSTLVLQLCAALASGRKDWIDLFAERTDVIKQMNRINYTKPQKVVFASYEDEIEEIDRRLQSISKHYDFAKSENINENFHCIDFTKLGAIWTPSSQGSGHISTVATQTKAGERLQQFCENLEARLLVIDPVAAAYGSEENARALVRAFMTFWLGWSRQTKCTVLFISHEPKNVNEDYKISGSTDWHAASRFVIHLGLDKSKTFGVKDRQLLPKSNKIDEARGLKVSLIKSNYGKKHLHHWVKLLDEQSGMGVCTEEEACYQFELMKGNIKEMDKPQEEEYYGDEPM